MDTRPEAVADYECTTGEGPIWHPEEGLLYWVDIPAGRLFRYDPTTGDHGQCHRTGVIGGLTIQEDGSLLLFEDRGRVERWRDGEVETVLAELPDERDSRFNDVVADPAGRVFCGTMPTGDRAGRLYRLDTDGSVTRVLDGLDIPNGMGFTPDRERLYVTETEAAKIYRFEYDEATGDLSDRDVFVDAGDVEGLPDGLTVDAEGFVWSAFWDGGRLVRYAPDGTEDRRIEFPARKVSSVAFGGEAYDEAYVTTALGPAEGTPGSRSTEGEGAGALFRVRPGVGGTAEFRSAIRT